MRTHRQAERQVSGQPSARAPWKRGERRLYGKRWSERKSSIISPPAGQQPQPGKTCGAEKICKLAICVFFQVEAGRLFVKMKRDVVRPRIRMGRGAQISAPGPQRLKNVSCLCQRVVGMQMLDELIAVRDVDRSGRHGDAAAIRKPKLEIRRPGATGGDHLRDVDRIDLGDTPGYGKGDGTIAGTDLQERGAAVQERGKQRQRRAGAGRAIIVLPVELRVIGNAPEELIIDLAIKMDAFLGRGMAQPVRQLLLHPIMVEDLLCASFCSGSRR